MVKGLFAKEYGKYRKSGGLMSRKEFVVQLWPEIKKQMEVTKNEQN